MTDNQTPPPTLKGAALITAAIILASANFIAILDTSIANVSVPNIAGALAVSPNQGTWVITSYAVAEAITVPLTGWLARRFGAVRTFSSAIILFGLFSALCGFSNSLGLLVVARVLQGLAGGPMIPLSQTILLSIFPREKAGLAIGIWSMTTLAGPVAGPILGGILCDNFGWSWIFFINVPLTAICGTAAWRMLRHHENQRARDPIDVVGLVLMVVWIAALQITLDKGKDLDWFGSSFIVALTLVAGIGFAAFLIWELTDDNPIVNLRVFRHRGFAISVLTLSLTYGGFFAGLVLGPLWLQLNLGYTATDAGYTAAMLGVLSVVMAPIAAILGQKLDPRLTASFGILGMAAANLIRTQFNLDMTFGQIALCNAFQGLFAPFFFISVLGMTVSSVNPSEIASATGISSFLRTLSGAFGTSVVQTSWDDSTKYNRAELAGLVHPLDRLHGISNDAGFSPAQKIAELSQMTESQSLMLATNHTFLVLAILMTVAASSIWLTARPKMRSGPATGH